MTDFFGGLQGFDDALPQPLAPRKRRDQNASAVAAEPGDDKPLEPMAPAPDNAGTTADTFHEEPHGVLASVLNELDRPFQAVGNLLTGNVEGAARQAGDFGLGLIGHGFGLIPTLSRPEDYTSGHQILGIDPTDSPWLSLGADLGAGIALNPLTYTGLGGIAKGYQAAGKAAMGGLAKVAPEAAAGLESGVADLGRGVRRWAGDTSGLSPKVAQDLNTSVSAGAKEVSAGQAALKASILSKMSAEDRQLIGDVMDNVRWENGKPVGKLGPDSMDPIQRLRQIPGLDPARLPQLEQGVAEAMDLGQQQAKAGNVFYKKSAPDPLLFGAEKSPQTGFGGDYLPRAYKGQTEDQAINEILGEAPTANGQPSAIKPQVLSAPEEIAQKLADNPGLEYDRDALSRLSGRVQQQGTLAARGALGKAITGSEDFAYADPKARKAVGDAIDAMTQASPEDARWLRDAFKGIGSRGPVTSALAKMSSFFKPYAVYGAFIPRVGSDVRNGISGVWQVMSNPESRAQTLTALKRLPSDLGRSIGSALGLKDTSKLGTLLSDVDEAMTASGGLSDNAATALEVAGKKDAAELLRSGVVSDGYVKTDEMVQAMDGNPWVNKFKSAMNWPAKIFKGLEDRMRAGLFMGLRQPGADQKSVEEAAKIVGDSLYRYNVNSAGNRLARDVIPFYQFSAKAIPQQARFLSENNLLSGSIRSGLSALYQHNDQPVYPYQEGALNIPIGQDEKGNNEFISGLGLPFESLSMLPDPTGGPLEFGREVKKGILSQAHPLIKTAAGLTFNQDPHFETPFNSYSKVAGQDAGSIGRAFNFAAGAGLIQPVVSPVQQIGQLFNPDEGIGAKLLDQLTGANVQSVDPNRALQSQLQQTLAVNPDIAQSLSLYDKSNDPKTQALLKQYNAAKKRVSEARKAEKAKAGPGDR